MQLINHLYLSVFIFSLIVFVDLVFKFKRPFLLKFYFAVLVLSTGSSALSHYVIMMEENVLFFFRLFCKVLAMTALLNILALLYFPKFRVWVYIISFSVIVLIGLFWIPVSVIDDVQKYDNEGFINLTSKGLEVSMTLKVIRFLFIFLIFSTVFYFCYSIIILFKFNNIYFKKIKAWTISILIFCLSVIVVPLLIKNELYIELFNVAAKLYLLLLVYYRPNFLNRSSLKIFFGDIFRKNIDYSISELDFIHEFYTNTFYIRKDASLENLASIMKVDSNDLYKFIYYKYTITFNDLVNKNRVEYFVNLIHNPKYLNYNIDGLARESGFSSRQHLYKPFKRYHGGNPSDIVDAIKY